MNFGAVGRVAPWVQMHWDWRAAGNFILGGTGAGLLIAVAASGLTPAAGVVLLGLASVIAGLVCVWTEIGRPWRALNVLRHPSTSWMSREALLAPLLIGCGLLAAGSGSPGWRWATALGAATYLYCQARMLQAARGIPAWRQPRSVPLMLATGLAEGSGLLAVWSVVSGASSRRLATLLILACLLRAAAWLAYRRGLRRDGAPNAARAVIGQLHWPLLMTDALAAIIATAASLSVAGWLLGLAGVAALANGWALKYTLVLRAAYNQGFALPMAPERGVGGHGPPARPGWD